MFSLGLNFKGMQTSRLAFSHSDGIAWKL